MDTQELIELGAVLVADGFGGHELTIRRMVRDARSSGAAGAAADVLADTTAPDVARFRAFAVVSAALTRAERSPGVVRPVA